MEMGMTPELMYGQSVYVPATANPYPYGYTEVGSPMEWYNHQSSLEYDGQEIYYPGFQTEGMQCVSYTAPDNGSIHPSYSPYPIDPSFIVDGSFLPQEYVADASDPTCQLVPSSYYIPSVLPYAQDGVLGSTTTPLQHPNFAYVPSMPGYAATSTNPALPLIASGAMKNGIVMNPPIQSTVVSSKQFHDHAKLPKAQLHNLVPLKQELVNGSMVPVKFPHTSQASTRLDDRPISSAKHPPKAKLSANNSFGFVGSDPHKWAAAEKFQPTSKPNGHLNGASQKVHLPNNSFGIVGSDPHKWAAAEKFLPTSKPNGHINGANQKVHLPNHNIGGAGEPGCQRSSTLVAKSYTSRLSVGNLDGTVLIRTDQYNSNDLRVDYPYAKFFVIKSIGEADVHKSIKYGVWSSSPSGNNKLDSAYRDADRIAKRNSTKCPVFLFFSVNGSGHFCGMAEMVGPVDFQKDMDFWFQDKWTGSFPVRWHIIKDVPNYTLQHILLQNNENKPVTHSRDTQEVPYVPGIYVLKILKDIKVKECLLDDFMRYEEDEARTKQHRRSKLSHNAPDFVPVSQRGKDASDAQQPKLGSVLIDRTLEIQNVSEKPHDCNVIKHQDPCLEAGEKQGSEAGKENGPGEKQGSEAGKENGHQETRCNGKQANEKVAKTVTNQPQTSNLKTSVDGKQQYWKKVELPRQTPDTAVHGSSKAPEKPLNGVKGSSAVVTKETPKGEIVVAKVGSLAISTQTREADNKSRSVDVVTIGSMPVRVNKSDG